MTLFAKIRRRWYQKSSRRVGPALAAIGAAATAGIGLLFLTTPGAVQADIPPGARIKVVVPANDKCGLENVKTHSLPSDEIAYETAHFVITRVADQTIPTDAQVRFDMTVDTEMSGCAMKQPITARVNGRLVKLSESEVSHDGATMMVAFHPPASKPTKTATTKPTKPTKTATAKPTKTATAKPTKSPTKPTKSPTAKPTKSPTKKPTVTPSPTKTARPDLPKTGAPLGPLVTVGLFVVVAGALLTAAASARRLRRSSNGK